MTEPRVEPENQWRVPTQRQACEWQHSPRCKQAPVADLLRGAHRPQWYGICADHLHLINREVRDGRVWWLG